MYILNLKADARAWMPELRGSLLMKLAKPIEGFGKHISGPSSTQERKEGKENAFSHIKK